MKTMRSSVVRYIIYGQICFYTGLLACIVLKPHGLAANDGISYYGVYRETVLPYVFALLGCAYFCIKAAEQFTEAAFKLLKYAFSVIGLLIIGIMVTPDSLSQFMDGLHRACGSSLFVVQLLLSGWFIVRLRYDWRAVGLTTLELAGGIASFIYLSPAHGLLLQAQILFQLSFGALAIYALKRLQADYRTS
jgi:cytochrome bd-type quinol oxidase subunit 2